MSRTIRRKNVFKYDPRHQSWFEDTVWLNSKYGGEYQVKCKCGGKERKRRFAEFHSDHYPKSNIGNTPRYYRKIDHTRYKMVVKTAIANYIKNDEYAIVVHSRPKPDYWD